MVASRDARLALHARGQDEQSVGASWHWPSTVSCNQAPRRVLLPAVALAAGGCLRVRGRLLLPLLLLAAAGPARPAGPRRGPPGSAASAVTLAASAATV